jgi:predicted flap endonuclease-1-like 5' DNA nuclease
VIQRWLPLMPYHTDDRVMAEFIKDVPEIVHTQSVYEYEPSAEAILEEIVPRFTELQLYQAILESQASEHAARMVAMRNASDNAVQLTTDLTLVYNKARQSASTAEILDIVGGANALQQSIDDLVDEFLATAPGSEALEVGGIASQGAPVVAASYGAATALASAPAKALMTTVQPDSADDLTVIEGIGKKMAGALTAAGIQTFARLAEATEAEIIAAIEAAGMRFAPSLTTWPEQAAFAARGDWEGLKAFQQQLTGGRKTQ